MSWTLLNPNIKEETEKIIFDNTKENTTFSKGDLYSYLPFYFWKLLNKNGKVGLITSNSWLGTEWGRIFRATLNKFYHIENIIVSGQGRWFKNADVVTTIMILNKRTSINELDFDEVTNFITIKNDLSNLEIQEIIEDIIIDNPNKNIEIQKYKTQELFELEFSWNALFSNISWLKKIENKLVPASSLFDINRGERRGWDPMFYPESSNSIEKDYIKPVLKSSREIDKLVTSADSEAFCCNKSISKITELKHSGALNWIKKFEHEVNGKNKPLPEVLKRNGCHWYEMKDETMADFVASMNFDKRLFIARLNTRSFVNQRLTRFTAKNNDLDLDLIHALLNSTLGIFFIESIGFGRGLGALDLSSTRMKNNLKMLNPQLLSDGQKTKIKECFNKLKQRKILPILEELEKTDRKDLDKIILDSFGILNYKDQIESALKNLYEIRMNAKS